MTWFLFGTWSQHFKRWVSKMGIRTYGAALPENLGVVLTSLATILPVEDAGKASLVWVFGGHDALNYQQDAEQVLALYSESPFELVFVVPEHLAALVAEKHQSLARVLLVSNPGFFAVIQAVGTNCIEVVAGRNFLFQRKTLFVSPAMLKVHAEEAAHDYEFPELNVEYVLNGIIHPLELSATQSQENQEYGGVTTADLVFVNLSATTRVNGRYQNGVPAPEWYVGANPNVNSEAIPYVDKDVVFLGALHKHYGHFILESLARLWYFLGKESQGFVAAYISHPGEDRFIEIFEFFGFKPEQLIRVEQPTRFRSVTVPEMSIRLHDRYHVRYKETIDRIVESIEPGCYEKVFFAKKMRRNYRGMGEQPIVDIFRDNGFHIAYPEMLSMQETIAVLKGCKVFAASSGSNAHNAIFLEDGVQVICLNRSPHIHYPQTMIDRMKGLQTYYVDAYFSLLPADWSSGPFLFGPNKCLLDFFNGHQYTYDYGNFVFNMPAYIYEYLRIWALYYNDDMRRTLIDPQDRSLTVASVSQSLCDAFEHLPVNILTQYE
jgi:hypothetical protein